jgi:hypothetical protein
MNFVMNAARVLTETFSAPTEESFIDLETGDTERHYVRPYINLWGRRPDTPVAPRRQRQRPPVLLKPTFKWALITVAAITVLSGITLIVLANIWHSPTPNQQSAFEAFDFAWKAGFGAICGLVGGKAT